VTVRIRHAGRTDRGRVRAHNEDAWVADPQQGLYVVADGMGGEFAGALAAKVVVETLPSLLRQKMAGIEDFARPGAATPLLAALAELSHRLRQETEHQPGLAGMGATVVLALIRGAQALVAHLGDSRAYLLRGGGLERLTRDHSLVQLLLDGGEITPAEAATHSARGQLTRNVGMAGEPLPEARVLALSPGDRLLLCTDGLTGMLSDAELPALAGPNQGPEETCARLVQAANEAGGKDNVTVVVMDVVEEP